MESEHQIMNNNGDYLNFRDDIMRHTASPIGVATYSIFSELPDDYRDMLPAS